MAEKKEEGLRFNEGKTRYDLIPNFATEQIAKVFTFGAKKYSIDNWKKGMKWSNMLSSLERHIEAFKKCEDYDKESGLLHLAHAGCNINMLLEYYKIAPEYDDRDHQYLRDKKIYLDIDGVLAGFSEAFKIEAKKMGIVSELNFSQPHWNFPYEYEPVWKKIMNDEEFWLNIKPICDHQFGFEPHGYVTARSIPDEWSKKWLSINNFPPSPLYSTKGKSKIDILKELECDIFVDDCWENFRELNKAGICTYLYHQEYNAKYEVGYKRIKSLTEL